MAKTTSAVHIAANLAETGRTALIDADPNQSASGWSRRGAGKLPFDVLGVYKAVSEAKRYEHLVMDTKARPDIDELRDLCDGCDLLIVPTTPDALALEGMMLTLDTLNKIGTKKFRVLLTIIPPPPMPEGREVRKALEDAGIPLFERGIRRLVAFQRAVADGATVGQVKDVRASLGSVDYQCVCDEIHEIVAKGNPR